MLRHCIRVPAFIMRKTLVELLGPANWAQKHSNGRLCMNFSQSTSHSDLSKDTLRLLCSVLIKSGTRLEICRLLDPAVFRDPMHRVIFEEIRDLGSIESRRLREILPERVISRGFPNFNLREFLAPYEVTEKEIDQLFESALQLLDRSHPDGEHLAE
jgi:hypothetical protein